MKAKSWILVIIIVIVCAAVPPLMASKNSGGDLKSFDITARQYAYNPPIIRVNKGDEVHITLSSLDVVHGFYLEGYDIDCEIEPGKTGFKMRHPSEGKEFKPVEEIVFIANRTGKFRYRCSHTCGSMHPFMLGEMIVLPNYPYLAGIGGAVGILFSFFLVFFLMEKNGNEKKDAELQVESSSTEES